MRLIAAWLPALGTAGSFSQRSLALTLLLLLDSLVAAAPLPHDPNQTYTYSLLGPSGLETRTITWSSHCPLLRAPGQPPLTMAQRVAPSQGFPGVCSHPGVLAAASASNQGAAVKAHKIPNIRRIVVLGDTGCRIKNSPLSQDCNDPELWPLPQIARSAAAEHPDLVLHVGDYLYREGPCTRSSCTGSPTGYGWESWEADFFEPMKPLLQSAPWIVVRGNHESCQRAAEGWFRLLDPFPYLPGKCNPAGPILATLDPPYGVSIGQGTRLLVMDSAAIREGKKEQPELISAYTELFKQLPGLINPQTRNWLVLHHNLLAYSHMPFLGFQGGNPELLQAWSAAFPPQMHFEAQLGLVIQGHIHTFELSRFVEANDPISLVAGYGGALLEPEFASRLEPHLAVGPSAHLLESYDEQRFGYLVLERKSAGTWLLLEKSPAGALRLRCTLQLQSPQSSFACGHGPAQGHHHDFPS